MAKLNQLAHNTLISLSGRNWIVVDPVTGLLQTQYALKNMVFDPFGNNSFNTIDLNNVGYYLNNTFYNTLSNEAKLIIKTTQWGVGKLTLEEGGKTIATPSISPSVMKSKENTEYVNAKIGLLSVSEIREYGNRYGFENNYKYSLIMQNRTWTRTGVNGGSLGGASFVWFYNSSGIDRELSTESSVAVQPVIYIDPNTEIINGIVVYNSAPTITDSTLNNKIFYEGDTVALSGSVTDADNGNIVAIKYSVNDGAAQTIKSSVSNGSTPISYSKTLTYTNKTLKDGIATLVTGLTDGTTYNIKIWAEDDKGGKSTITTRNFTVVTNRPPTISGADGNLGDKNATFNLNYMITDADGDAVTVTEKLNGTVIKTITNAPQNVDTTITISNETLYGLTLGITNTIEIRAEDSKGSVSYRRYTFKRSNSAPKISGQDADLGVKTQEFNVTFSATDVEATSMSAKVFLNDTLKESYAIIDSQDYTYTMTRNDFLQLDTAQHNIRIEVTDSDGGTAIRNFNFTKTATKLEHGIKINTDAMSTQVLITPTYYLATGAILKVLVCNNINDVVPAWENATEQVLAGRHYNFLNATKTDLLGSWGVGVKISIEKGTATEKSYLSGYGGAYK